MRSERGLSTTLHCLQWYKLVLRTHLSTAAVQYPIIKQPEMVADCLSQNEMWRHKLAEEVVFIAVFRMHAAINKAVFRFFQLVILCK